MFETLRLTKNMSKALLMFNNAILVMGTMYGKDDEDTASIAVMSERIATPMNRVEKLAKTAGVSSHDKKMSNYAHAVKDLVSKWDDTTNGSMAHQEFQRFVDQVIIPHYRKYLATADSESPDGTSNS